MVFGGLRNAVCFSAFLSATNSVAVAFITLKSQRSRNRTPKSPQFQHQSTRPSFAPSCPSTLYQSSPLESGQSRDGDGSQSNIQPDYGAEETLLKIHFATQPNVPLHNATQALSKFCQSFPFAAVLPVQPLHYLPTEDGGVFVKFLRKKTQLKSGVDGGIRFFLNVPRDPSEEPTQVELTAKRNSVGQSIPKIFAEKLVITSFVKALTDDTSNEPSKEPPGLSGEVSVSSIFHKWM